MKISTKHPYAVLLFYKYVDITDTATTIYDHLAFCKSLGLLGRIYMSEEGVNGTCAGTPDAIRAYLKYMDKHPLFVGIDFKVDYAEFCPFRKMFVRYRPEIVASGIKDGVNPRIDGGTHLAPHAFHEMAKTDPDAVLFDARNDYEWKIGTFEGAVTPDIQNFRELKEKIDNHEFDHLKEKKLLMFCTGGIRCEKASSYFKKAGFENVYQLHGGIIKYGQQIEKKESLYKGKCFVFDDRLSVPITDDVLAACHHCGLACDRYLNCTNAECNALFVCCDTCKQEHNHACSDDCAKTPREKWHREDIAIA